MLKAVLFFAVAGAALTAALLTAPARAMAGSHPVTLCFAGVEMKLTGAAQPMKIRVSEHFACGCDRKCSPVMIRVEPKVDKSGAAVIRKLNI